VCLCVVSVCLCVCVCVVRVCVWKSNRAVKRTLCVCLCLCVFVCKRDSVQRESERERENLLEIFWSADKACTGRGSRTVKASLCPSPSASSEPTDSGGCAGR
jgi:hypothetical protein